MSSAAAPQARQAPRPRRGPSTGATRPRYLRVVRPDQGRGRRPVIVAGIVITLVFGTLFGLAALNALLVQGQVRIDRVQQQISDRELLVDQLELQIAGAHAPERIRDRAEAMGMVQPSDTVHLAPVDVDASRKILGG